MIFSAASIYHPMYLLSALLIALFWLRFSQGQNLNAAIKILFPKIDFKNLSASFRLDAKLCTLNLLFIRPLTLAIEVACFLGVYQFGFEIMNQFRADWRLSELAEGILATAATMLAIDLASYFVHRLLHSRILWPIHRVHHSAESLNILTTFRQHPLEPLILYAARGAFAGIALALLHTLLPQQSTVITLFGLGVGFVAYNFTVNLHHFHVPVRYPKILTFILISPHHHHIHHSRAARHRDCNFGVVFSVWDRIFGTFREQNLDINELNFGLSDEDYKHGLIESIALPIKKLPAATAARFLFFLFFFPFS